MDPEMLDQKLGPKLNWQPVPRPERAPLVGRHVTLEPLDAAAHADSLYEAAHGDNIDPLLWLYLGYGPWEDVESYRQWVQTQSESTDPHFYAIVPSGERASGQATYLRIDEKNGVIEIGHIWFGASMQRSRAATEAIYLLAKHAFDDLGYRRLEWKCHAKNQRSRVAAERFGFTFEGIFRNAVIQRDRNRDTAWFAITDEDWPSVRDTFETWLADDNFDKDGKQFRSLGDIRTAS